MIRLKKIILYFVAQFCERLGDGFEKIEKYGLAIKFFENALGIYLNLFKKPKKTVAELYKKIGLAWSQNDDLGKAIEYCEGALAEDLKIYSGWKPFDRGHFILAGDWSMLGNQWLFYKDYDKAIQYMEMSLPVLVEILGDLDPGVALQREFLGNAWEEKGDKMKALELYNKALLGYQKYDFGSSVKHVQRQINALEDKMAE